ncbi:MAG TPA: hypothetical protein VKD67_02705 [Acidimicrobiales bacterium]|jgi:hypothetical protein|nr:hypothetical protein [Acidimicrobiales bacterium]
MRTKLRNLLEVWSDGGLTVRLGLTNGEVLEGHVRELDRDEIVIEPIVNGQPGPITVVLVDHIVTATYTDRPANLDE